MNSYQSARFLQGLAAYAQVEAMKVANMEKQIKGEVPAYSSECFFEAISTIDNIAQDLMRS